MIPEDMLLYVLGAGFLSILSLIASVITFRKLSLFTQGKKGSSLESTIHELLTTCNAIREDHEALSGDHETLKHHYQSCIRGHGMVKYNPYQDAGGNQSSSIALLNAYGDGIILTHLHHRTTTRVFTKPVVGMTCQQRLTEEESEALQIARKRL